MANLSAVPAASSPAPDEFERVLASIEIPACPDVVMQVMAEVQKDEPDINRLAHIIASDVGMSAMTLKLANSALFNRGAAVSSVPHAVARLGTGNIQNIVVASGLRASMSGLPDALLEKFWDRAAVLAVAAGLVARRQYGISSDSAYTFALFHDAAVPVMMRRFKPYAALLEKAQSEGGNLCAIEQEHFSCSHDVVGALLARNWGLPAVISLAIRFHHDPDVFGLPESALPREALPLIAVTHVAEYLTAEILEEADTDVGPVMYAKALAYLGVTEADASELRDDLEQALRATGR